MYNVEVYPQMKKCTILWICVGILVFLFWRGRMEGFLSEPPQAPVPQPKQVSFISADASSSTTANPFLAQPDYRDWWNARDSFRYFLDIYSASKAKEAGIVEEANRMLLQAPQALALIQKYIRNPEEVPTRTVLRDGRIARKLADQMRRIGPMNPQYYGEQSANISNRNDDLLAR